MTSENSVEGRLKARVAELGGRAFKMLPWVQRGLPDRLVVIPGQVWFIETKAPGKTLKKHQVRMRALIEGLGLNWATLDTRAAVDFWYVARWDEVQRRNRQ